jgi:hypothetical protein
MSPTQVVAIAVRLFAVLIAVFTLGNGFTALYMLTGDQATLGVAVVVLLTVSVPLIIAVLLWTFPMTVAGKLLPRTRADAPAPVWHASDVQAAALAIIGMWLVIDMLLNTIYWIVFLMNRRSGYFADIPLSPENIGDMVSTAAQLVLGLALILGAHGLTRMLHIVRYGSAPTPAPETAKGADGAPRD